MEKDNLEKMFHRLKDDFDLEDTSSGHQKRFLKKLQASSEETTKRPIKNVNLKPWIGIAAGFVFILSIGLGITMKNQPTGLAAVSPEMAQTQDFYSSVIHRELRKISKHKSPETKVLIEDAMAQMKKLEVDFEALRKDLIISGDDNRVIYAMITNFQNRINILNKVLEQIENVEQVKQNKHENPTTI